MTEDEEILAVARAGFLDEANDMLRQFEQGLLAIEQDPNDTEAMNSAFRAAHTIKGTAGLFGFDAVVSFTHEVESVLESMRSGKLPLTDAAMALLLQGRDQMERLLAEVGAGAADPAVAQQSEDIGEALRALRGVSGTGGQAPAATKATAEQTAAAEAPAAAGSVWHISLHMGADALRNGLDPLSFIRYLDTIGKVVGIRTVTDKVPALSDVDAEACYLGFEIRLVSEADRTTIERVFEFLMDDCDLVILAPNAPPAEYEQLLAKRAPDDASRASLLALWQELAGPNAPPFIERRKEESSTDRRQSEPERRNGQRDRRAGGGSGDDTRFIRVRADKLDKLIDLIGELVIASSGAQLAAQQERSPRFGEAALRIHDLVQEARDGALGLRMVPIGETFTRFQRVVRDVCKQLSKDVELVITGGDTELDKSMVETIADPLMHLVRNSLDHGIESPQDREAAGKTAQGTLSLNAYHESGSIVIEVSDDGRGLNRERILNKAIERGLVTADQKLTDEEVNQLIFLPGFSTAEQVTNLSGRGVGMDVVKRNIESLRGQLRIMSTFGEGTTIQIRLPLTLAIIDGFLTSVGGVSYVLPLELVAECLEVPPECVGNPERVAGHFDLRGEVLPYLDIARFYRHTAAPNGRRSLVLVRDGASRIGLIVDRLHGEHQTVIKPLGQVFRDIRGLAGSTILGSGEVALILDVPALLNLATERLRATKSAPNKPNPQTTPAIPG